MCTQVKKQERVTWVLQLQLKVLHLEMTPRYLAMDCKLWLHTKENTPLDTHNMDLHWLLKIVSWLDTISIGLWTIRESQPSDFLCCDLASNATWLTVLNLPLQCNQGPVFSKRIYSILESKISSLCVNVGKYTTCSARTIHTVIDHEQQENWIRQKLGCVYHPEVQSGKSDKLYLNHTKFNNHLTQIGLVNNLASHLWLVWCHVSERTTSKKMPTHSVRTFNQHTMLL